jgi:LexA-binding, inner membrane-associated putative hydrolase
MAGYKTHITVSGALGVGYGTAGAILGGFSPVEGALAGILTWFSGMLPDLDSASGRPVREVFSLLAAFAPFAMMGHLMEWTHHSYEAATLLAVILYVTIRYGGQAVLNRTAVHRGMFHSIPAMVITAEIAFLAFRGSSVNVKLLMAGGAAIGFFSHLVLDEIYSVEWSGVHVRLNKFAGSAVKFFGGRLVPNVITYSLLMLLTYAALMQANIVQTPSRSLLGPPLQRAAADEPDFH